MRKVGLVGMMVSAAILVFGLMLVPITRAGGEYAPAFQTTATATAGAETDATPETTVTASPVGGGDATATVGATIGATVEATGTATAGAMMEATGTAMVEGATVAAARLPNTGSTAGPNVTMLVIAAALLVFGIATAATWLASRRGTQP